MRARMKKLQKSPIRDTLYETGSKAGISFSQRESTKHACNYYRLIDRIVVKF